MLFDSYLEQKVTELDTRIGEVRRYTHIYKGLYHAMHIPQIVLSVAITATGLSDLIDEAMSRRVIAALGISHLLIQALVVAVPCARRVSDLEQERKSLVRMRNELMVARTHDLTAPEKERLIARLATYVAGTDHTVLTDVVTVSS
jgi:hypothetical protein